MNTMLIDLIGQYGFSGINPTASGAIHSETECSNAQIVSILKAFNAKISAPGGGGEGGGTALGADLLQLNTHSVISVHDFE